MLKPLPKVYVGVRRDERRSVWVEGDALPSRTDLRPFAKDFDWGDAGDGAAQLALALAADHLRDDQAALAAYERLKAVVVVRLSWHSWVLSEDEVARALVVH